MPSIFTRSRTASSAAKSLKSNNGDLLPPLPPKDAPDELGRVTSRGSVAPSPTPKKDKKKETKAAARLRTQSSPQEADTPTIPDGSFLPFSLAPQENLDEPRPHLQKYGYLSYQSEVVLGLEEVTRLVEVISDELSQRGVWWIFVVLDSTHIF
jgi:hypothetical protein